MYLNFLLFIGRFSSFIGRFSSFVSLKSVKNYVACYFLKLNMPDLNLKHTLLILIFTLTFTLELFNQVKIYQFNQRYLSKILTIFRSFL